MLDRGKVEWVVGGRVIKIGEGRGRKGKRRRREGKRMVDKKVKKIE